MLKAALPPPFSSATNPPMNPSLSDDHDTMRSFPIQKSEAAYPSSSLARTLCPELSANAPVLDPQLDDHTTPVEHQVSPLSVALKHRRRKEEGVASLGAESKSVPSQAPTRVLHAHASQAVGGLGSLSSCPTTTTTSSASTLVTRTESLATAHSLAATSSFSLSATAEGREISPSKGEAPAANFRGEGSSLKGRLPVQEGNVEEGFINTRNSLIEVEGQSHPCVDEATTPCRRSLCGWPPSHVKPVAATPSRADRHDEQVHRCSTPSTVEETSSEMVARQLSTEDAMRKAPLGDETPRAVWSDSTTTPPNNRFLSRNLHESESFTPPIAAPAEASWKPQEELDKEEDVWVTPLDSGSRLAAGEELCPDMTPSSTDAPIPTTVVAHHNYYPPPAIVMAPQQHTEELPTSRRASAQGSTLAPTHETIREEDDEKGVAAPCVPSPAQQTLQLQEDDPQGEGTPKRVDSYSPSHRGSRGRGGSRGDGAPSPTSVHRKRGRALGSVEEGSCAPASRRPSTSRCHTHEVKTSSVAQDGASLRHCDRLVRIEAPHTDRNTASTIRLNPYVRRVHRGSSVPQIRSFTELLRERVPPPPLLCGAEGETEEFDTPCHSISTYPAGVLLSPEHDPRPHEEGVDFKGSMQKRERTHVKTCTAKQHFADPGVALPSHPSTSSSYVSTPVQQLHTEPHPHLPPPPPPLPVAPGSPHQLNRVASSTSVLQQSGTSTTVVSTPVQMLSQQSQRTTRGCGVGMSPADSASPNRGIRFTAESVTTPHTFRMLALAAAPARGALLDGGIRAVVDRGFFCSAGGEQLTPSSSSEGTPYFTTPEMVTPVVPPQNTWLGSTQHRHPAQLPPPPLPTCTSIPSSTPLQWVLSNGSFLSSGDPSPTHASASSTPDVQTSSMPYTTTGKSAGMPSALVNANHDHCAVATIGELPPPTAVPGAARRRRVPSLLLPPSTAAVAAEERDRTTARLGRHPEAVETADMEKMWSTLPPQASPVMHTGSMPLKNRLVESAGEEGEPPQRHRHSGTVGHGTRQGPPRRCAPPPPPSPAPLVARLEESPYHYIMRNFVNGSFLYYQTADGKSAFFSMCQSVLHQVRCIFEQETLHPGIGLFPSVAAPAYVLGDIHGNFEDLSFFLRRLLLFHDFHLTPANMVCLGDYVDRGAFSLECVMLLFSLKVMCPNKMVMLRGNHEDRAVCGDLRTYGMTCFASQCQRVFGYRRGMELFRDVTEVFRYLPLAAELIIRPPIPPPIEPCAHPLGAPPFTTSTPAPGSVARRATHHHPGAVRGGGGCPGSSAQTPSAHNLYVRQPCVAIQGPQEEATDLIEKNSAVELACTWIGASGQSTRLDRWTPSAPTWPSQGAPPPSAGSLDGSGTHAAPPSRILCAHGGIPRFTAEPREQNALGQLRTLHFPRFLTLFPQHASVRDRPESAAPYFHTHLLSDLLKRYPTYAALWDVPLEGGVPEAAAPASALQTRHLSGSPLPSTTLTQAAVLQQEQLHLQQLQQLQKQHACHQQRARARPTSTSPQLSRSPSPTSMSAAPLPFYATLTEGHLRQAWFTTFDLLWSDPMDIELEDLLRQQEEAAEAATRHDAASASSFLTLYDDASGKEKVMPPLPGSSRESTTPTVSSLPVVNEWGFSHNERGSHVLSFSGKAVQTFLRSYGYRMLFRAHQEKAHGLRWSKSNRVLTIFSTSNYMSHGNGAGCVIVSGTGEVQMIEKVPEGEGLDVS